ncbi:MAG: hypothetical protein LUD02_09420 [Tannerellaceae bacterium]|nr:hypothetical protein [Tannerellaceae bacterium]MCD8264334.1 hypothetical protein [Tannerellaceae bacterium]
MRIDRKINSFLAGMLLFLFILPAVGKTIHMHQCAIRMLHCTDEGHHHPVHQCEDCSICNFILYYYTPVESDPFTPVTLYAEIIQVEEDESIYITNSLSCYLRGPPQV